MQRLPYSVTLGGFLVSLDRKGNVVTYMAMECLHGVICDFWIKVLLQGVRG
jgi:hypothetical protein